MVTVNVRNTISDYAMWRPIFAVDDGHRRAAGPVQVYRDVYNPNIITIPMERDNVNPSVLDNFVFRQGT